MSKQHDWFKWNGIPTHIYGSPENLERIYVRDKWLPCLHVGPLGLDFVVTFPNVKENLIQENSQIVHAGIHFDDLIERFLMAEAETTDIEMMKARRITACNALSMALDKLTHEPFRCKPPITFVA